MYPEVLEKKIEYVNKINKGSTISISLPPISVCHLNGGEWRLWLWAMGYGLALLWLDVTWHEQVTLVHLLDFVCIICCGDAIIICYLEYTVHRVFKKKYIFKLKNNIIDK